jgi:ribA/ribD-fused uncharacterized protein
MPYYMVIKVTGAEDPLSNFYPTLLQFDGDTFKSAKHIYQSRKAIFHEMYDLDDQIRHAPTAKEAKTIANQIKVNETWEEVRPVIMAEILKIKYTQCADFREKLTNSKGYLDHNVKSSFWGTGPDGKRQNVFGLLLAALRIGVQ